MFIPNYTLICGRKYMCSLSAQTQPESYDKHMLRWTYPLVLTSWHARVRAIANDDMQERCTHSNSSHGVHNVSVTSLVGWHPCPGS